MFKNINLFVNILYVISKTIHQPIYDELIKALIKARKEAKLTQQQVADLLGKPQSYVAKIENKERKLDVIELIHFSDILKIKANTLIATIEWKKVR